MNAKFTNASIKLKQIASTLPKDIADKIMMYNIIMVDESQKYIEELDSLLSQPAIVPELKFDETLLDLYCGEENE